MSDCPKDDFCLLMLWLELMEVQLGAPPRSGGLQRKFAHVFEVRCGARAKKSKFTSLSVKVAPKGDGQPEQIVIAVIAPYKPSAKANRR